MARSGRLSRRPAACLPGGSGGRPPLLVLPAPFKRAYIWDLLPEVSVIRAAQAAGLRPYLLEWLDPPAGERGGSLADYACRLPEAAVNAVLHECGGTRVHLIGHSLGGTFAAIFASLRPERVGRLGLIDAPLAFGRDGGPIAEAVRRGPDARAITALFGGPVPGAAIDVFSVAAVPDAFVAQRWADLFASLPSAEALRIHLGVLRWTLDEFPLADLLFEEIAEDLYHHDRFRQGGLALGDVTAALARLEAPVAAVLNPAGRVVPPVSVLAGLRAARSRERLVLRYRPEPGPAIQHLGPLVAPNAHRRLWPRILRWLRAG